VTRTDGRLGVLDVGSSLGLPDGLPVTFERLIRARQSGGPAEVDAALRLAGLVRPGQRLAG
jgi:hypothetical protein